MFRYIIIKPHLAKLQAMASSDITDFWVCSKTKCLPQNGPIFQFQEPQRGVASDYWGMVAVLDVTEHWSPSQSARQ